MVVYFYESFKNTTNTYLNNFDKVCKQTSVSEHVSNVSHTVPSGVYFGIFRSMQQLCQLQ